MANEMAMKNEFVFVMFDDVLKSSAASILRLIMRDEYRKEYEKFIDYSKFEHLNDKELNYFCMTRKRTNILAEVLVHPFDVTLTLFDIVYNHPEVLLESDNLAMVDSLNILADQSFTKKIYIYFNGSISDGVDKCVAKLFGGKSNCFFIKGDFKEAIRTIKDPISLYIINDANRVYDIIECGKIHYTDILIANYGYNYIYDFEQKVPVLKITDSDKLSKAESFRINMFIPYTKDQLQINK